MVVCGNEPHTSSLLTLSQPIWGLPVPEEGLQRMQPEKAAPSTDQHTLGYRPRAEISRSARDVGPPLTPSRLPPNRRGFEWAARFVSTSDARIRQHCRAAWWTASACGRLRTRAGRLRAALPCRPFSLQRDPGGGVGSWRDATVGLESSPGVTATGNVFRSGSSSEGGGSVRLWAGMLMSRTRFGKPPGVVMHSIRPRATPSWGETRADA